MSESPSKSKPTHILSLSPTDVLFFKDGRPMDGSSSGHGAAWPLPHVIDSAIHAALHRSGHAENSHKHTIGKSSDIRNYEDESQRTRIFGSLQSAGPFPISPENTWYFPRPADADKENSALVTHHPYHPPAAAFSSLPTGMLPVVNTQPPNKNKAQPWFSQEAYQAYLNDETTDYEKDSPHLIKDDTIYATEHNIGIGIDPETQTQDGESFYSAHYLRLKPGWKLGLLSSCHDKEAGDLIDKTFLNSGTKNQILAGGQQRTCTVERKTPNQNLPLPLPLGAAITGNLVKWTLLTPAIFPEINPDPDKNIPHHPGGSLPTWVHPESLRIQLKDPTAALRKPGERRTDWRKRVAILTPIPAQLVASIMPRAIPVTGWSLGKDDSSPEKSFGAKSTHLAVPAGSVYYFKCDDETAAKNLASALNWHGTTTGTSIQNRRSSLLGEKGFGLGVCSNWNYHNTSKTH